MDRESRGAPAPRFPSALGKGVMLWEHEPSQPAGISVIARKTDLTGGGGEARSCHGPYQSGTPVTNPAAASQESPALCRRSDATGGSRGRFSPRAAVLPPSCRTPGPLRPPVRVRRLSSSAHTRVPLPTAATRIWCEPSLISGRPAPETTAGRLRGPPSLRGLAPLPQSHEWNTEQRAARRE